MIKIKHLMDELEADDGQRLWVESVGLTRDLRDWCKIDHVLPHLGPAGDLAEWFDQHPDGYDYFRAKYHGALSASPYRMALQHLAKAAARENFTLVHTGENPAHNTATALYEFLAELGAWSPRREG